MAHKKIEILLVDDEEFLLTAIALGLEFENFVVTTASSGKSAFEILKDRSFDLVLSDVKMPDGDGFWLLDQVVNSKSISVPVILITAFSVTTKQEAIELGAADLILKPVDFDTLLAVIRMNLR